MSEFDHRLDHYGPSMVPAAHLVESLLKRRRWTRRDKGDQSRAFLPPRYSRGEPGLRIHFESKGHFPALAFGLKELREHGLADEAARVHLLVSRVLPDTPPDKFPSIPLDTLLATWEYGGREAVRVYAIARRKCDRR
jgi:hypothetical protein